MDPYVELHCHSAFSLGDGASTPEALVARAAELDYPALALTDHDDLGGAVRFSNACRGAGIQPILGAELTLDDDSHLTLLVEDAAGWRNLATLITHARTRQPRGRPAVSLDTLAGHAAGLIALSGCPRGRIPRALAGGRYAAARNAAATLGEIFPERFYLELWDHRTHAEASLCADLLDLAREFGLPWTVTHNVHYATQAGRRVHDLLVCLRHGLTIEEAERTGVLRPSAEWCLQPSPEMARRWRSLPQGIQRTREIAERCENFRLLDLRPAPPRFPLPEAWRSADDYLEHLARNGLRERLSHPSQGHLRQLQHELELIRRLGLANHFLIPWDICRFARENGVMCQGRGSAANSLVCYALRVTAVDPVAHDLLFERFVSAERAEIPDIDIDFAAHQARERVIQYVYGKYGRTHAAMVCTHVEYRGRSAVRDAMRGMGFPAEQADWLAKRVDGHTGALAAAEWLMAEDGRMLRRIGLDPAEPRARTLVRLVRGLNGLPRHRATHSGGIVLSREPLGELVPIEPAAMENRTILQWDKDDCADMGLPKYDLLGLGMLRLLGECLDHVRAREGREIDIGRIPLDDPAVYAQIRAADTVGLFQIESRAQAGFLPRLEPRCFYDIVISVGAIRPGPMLGGQVKTMLARRRGEAATEYPHPELESVLGRTHGLALFQEQLMRAAVAVSGCTPGEADRLRRAMSRKRSSQEMQRATQAIRDGMQAREVEAEAAERVLAWLEACASYTFPESHAISFALLAYASAWLRHHYPAEYLCANLNAQPMGFYPISTLVHDARAHGVEVRPVDLAHSGWDCTLERRDTGDTPAVRMGLRFVRGMGNRAGEQLRAAIEGGPFASVADVVERSGLAEAELRALAAAGAFRSWVAGSPREALWVVLGETRGRRTGGPLAPAATVPAELPAMSGAEQTLADHRAVGVDLAGHPMRHLRERLGALGVISIAELRTAGRNGERATTAGLVIVRQKPGTAKGFVFLGLEDETARLDVIITPQLYARERELINGNGILAVRGRIGVEDAVVNLKAERFFPLDLEDATEVVRSHDYH